MIIGIIADTLMIFLVTYAVIDIISRIFYCFFNNKKEPNDKTLMLLYIDSESNVEDTVRSCALSAKNIGYELLVIFSDTNEETEKIILELSDDYPHMHTLKMASESITQIFSDISSKDA